MHVRSRVQQPFGKFTVGSEVDSFNRASDKYLPASTSELAQRYGGRLGESPMFVICQRPFVQSTLDEVDVVVLFSRTNEIGIQLGGLAQLGERLHGMQEVIGSSPLSSMARGT